MVIFNDLRITEDRDCLIVDCAIEDIDGYDGMYIDSIVVDYYKNVSDDGSPSDKAIAIYEHKDDEPVYTGMRVMLKAHEIADKKEEFGTDTFVGGLFFVTVICDGTPSNPAVLESYGCGADNTVDVGVAVDWYSVYQNGIGYAAKIAYNCDDPCDIPTGFEPFILAWYALRLAIDTCNWALVKRLWDKFSRALIGVDGRAKSSGCGCRG